MEKLTWLASERRMSQEGESEEENSQEENSEPEEEEEEEAEGTEALQKEDGVSDETVGDAAEKPPSTLASPQTAPEGVASITPAGQCSRSPKQGKFPSAALPRDCAKWTLSPGAFLPSPNRLELSLCRKLKSHQHLIYTRLPCVLSLVVASCVLEAKSCLAFMFLLQLLFCHLKQGPTP